MAKSAAAPHLGQDVRLLGSVESLCVRVHFEAAPQNRKGNGSSGRRGQADLRPERQKLAA